MGGARRLASGLLVVERCCAGPAGEPVPALVLLHGFGKYYGHLLDLWSGLTVECAVVAIQAGFRMGPAAYRWFAYRDLPDGTVAIAKGEEQRSREALITFLHGFRHDHPGRKTFLLGHSQGGMMALSVALMRPDLVDGCAAVNARVLPEVLDILPGRPDLTGMPVFVGHGTADPVVPVERGRAARDLLSSMGARLAYREYPEEHDVTPAMLSDVADWLRAATARARLREAPACS